MRGEWIEIDRGAAAGLPQRGSLPMRGEWIEIQQETVPGLHPIIVSPHAGRVD